MQSCGELNLLAFGRKSDKDSLQGSNRTHRSVFSRLLSMHSNRGQHDKDLTLKPQVHWHKMTRMTALG